MANRTVRPRALSARIAAQKSRRPTVSMPVVGSSSTTRSGSGSSARANRSRCCWPPEHFPTTRSARSAMPARSRTSSTGRALACSAATSRTVSTTVTSRSRPPDWRTAEIRPAATDSCGAAPKTRTVPRSGRVNPRSMSRVVVLPAPLGPRKATISPGRTVRERPSTAATEPKLLWRPSSSTAGVVCGFGVMGTTMLAAAASFPGRASRRRHDDCHGSDRGRFPP